MNVEKKDRRKIAIYIYVIIPTQKNHKLYEKKPKDLII